MHFSYLIKASRYCNASLFLYVLLLFISMFGLVSCSDKHNKPNVQPAPLILPSYLLSGKTMGTQYNIKVILPKNYALGKGELQRLIDDRLININQTFSTYIKQSELSLLNKFDTNTPHSVSAELFYMLTLSETISQQSQGAFDSTIGPLVNIWGFGPDKSITAIPTQSQILEAKSKTGFTNIQLNKQNNTVNKLTDVYIDLSAIAKGYGCDLIAQLLKENGLTHFMVEIGGEIYVEGHNDKQQKWLIGVEKPSLAQVGAVQAIAVSGVAVATSGDYRNYYEQNGKRISHTISPQTGEPIKHNLASVTVIAKTAAQADGYATAINVLGPKAGYDLAVKLNLAVYLLLREGEQYVVKYTPAFKPYMID